VAKKPKQAARNPRKRRAPKREPWHRRVLQRSLHWARRLLLSGVVAQLVMVVLYNYVNPPTDLYILTERWRLGAIKQDWVALKQVPADVPRALVAAEDADFCLHWGFDLRAIRAVVNSNSNQVRGASTISQQMVKNVYLWPGRTWIRKLFEAELTVLVEMVWSKRRIIEVYMNMVEFDEGVFGIDAAAQNYFGVPAHDLTLEQAARLAAILPNPKARSASKPTAATLRRTEAIISGAQTIKADGRDRCFSG